MSGGENRATAVVVGPEQAGIRRDLRHIADLITPGSRVLDVGCGDGALLKYLAEAKNVDGRGMELSMPKVSAAVAQGLSVIQGDLERDLSDYPDDAFDYVILSQTIQATYNPRDVLTNLLRIGKRAIVSLPNFGHWASRFYLLFRGRMPVTRDMPYEWWNTPNIHFCTLSDFSLLCEDIGLVIEKAIALKGDGTPTGGSASSPLANLMAQQAVFVLRRPDA